MRLVFHSKEKLDEYLSKVKLRIRECGWISLATAKMLAECQPIRRNDHLKVYWSVESFIVSQPRPWIPCYAIYLDEDKSGSLYERSLAVAKTISDRHNDGLNAIAYAVDAFNKIKMDGETNMGPKDETTSVNYWYDGKPIGKITNIVALTEHDHTGISVEAELNKSEITEYIRTDVKETFSMYRDILYKVHTAQYTKMFDIERASFKNMNTTVTWGDGTKTAVKCQYDNFDPEKQLAMAFVKRFLGNRNDYLNILKRWIPKDIFTNSTVTAYKCKYISNYGILRIIFNGPATIVEWADDTKTVVKCTNEKFDPEKGVAMAITKKCLGNRGNYFYIFEKWVPKKTFGKIIETENINRFYIELPDGYRLIFEDGEYAGRYNPESESDVTAPVTDNTNAPFIAGKRHKIVCASDCYHVKNIKPENRLYFNSFEEAIANGCRPCKHCNGMHKEINKAIKYGTILPNFNLTLD